MVSENVGKIYFICVLNLLYLFNIYAFIHICMYSYSSLYVPTLRLDHAGSALQ